MIIHGPIKKPLLSGQLGRNQVLLFLAPKTQSLAFGRLWKMLSLKKLAQPYSIGECNNPLKTERKSK